MPSPDKTALIGIFPEHEQAANFVSQLQAAGFQKEQIAIAGPEDKKETLAEEGGLVGAVTGGAVGAIAGGIATSILLPGTGPIILLGGLVPTLLASTATGAAAGGIVGVLVGLGIPEEEARRHEDALREGQTLVVVQAENRFSDALAILRRCEGQQSDA